MHRVLFLSFLNIFYALFYFLRIHILPCITHHVFVTFDSSSRRITAGGVFTEDDEYLIEILGKQAGVTLHNAKQCVR